MTEDRELNIQSDSELSSLYDVAPAKRRKSEGKSTKSDGKKDTTKAKVGPQIDGCETLERRGLIIASEERSE